MDLYVSDISIWKHVIKVIKLHQLAFFLFFAVTRISYKSFSFVLSPPNLVICVFVPSPAEGDRLPR